MKIGFLVKDITIFGGVERVVTTIANELAKDDSIEIKIISLFRPQNDSILFRVSDDIEVIYLNYESKSNKSLSVCLHTFKHFYKELKKIPLDVIVSVNTYHNIYLSLLKKILGYKVIAWHHEDYYNDTPKWNRLKQVFYPLLDKVIVLTERDLYEYQKFCKNAKVIQNPSPFKRDNLYNSGSTHILSLGRLSVEKSFEYMIIAFSKMNEQYKNWTLEIVGDGPEKENLMKLIVELNLTNQVTITPFTKDVISKYKTASFTMLTSQKEGLPMMLIESKTLGVPTISFDVRTGPREIIRDGIDGILVNPNDIDGLVKAMLTLMENKEKREVYSLNAVEDAQKYELNYVLSIWKETLNNI